VKMMGGGRSNVPAPTPVTPMPTSGDAEVRAAENTEVAKRRAQAGRTSTVLTGRGGDTGTSEARTQLLA
jgi:hypothetical protein